MKGRMASSSRLTAAAASSVVASGAVVAERAEIFEGHLAVCPLGVEKIEESDAAAPVRELDGIARLAGLRQIGIGSSAPFSGSLRSGRERRVNVRQRLAGSASRVASACLTSARVRAISPWFRSKTDRAG